MKALAQRYAVAAMAFAAAAVWLGVGVVSGLECLLAFLVTSVAMDAVQRRNRVQERRRRSTSRPREQRRPRPAVEADDADDWQLAEPGW